MVALLVVTGYLNIMLNNMNANASDNANGEQNGDFFAMYRAARISDRNETLAILDSIINNEASTQQEKSDATAKKMAIVASSELELELETLIKARGFSDAAVTNTTDNINIIVKASETSKEQVAQILDVIVTTIPDQDLNVIKVIPVEG